MPTFMYTVIFASIMLWAFLYRFMGTVAPDGFSNIFTFLALLFLAVSLTLSMPIYFYLQAKAPTFSNLRYLYRKSLRWSMFLALGPVFYLGLRAFNLDNLINTILYFVLYLLVFLQLRTKR